MLYDLDSLGIPEKDLLLRNNFRLGVAATVLALLLGMTGVSAVPEADVNPAAPDASQEQPA